MSSIKYMSSTLYNVEDVKYILEIYFDEKKEKKGVLILPVFVLDTIHSYHIEIKKYDVVGKQLDCLERQFFDNLITEIPIEEFEEPVKFEELVLHTLPPKIYKLMLDGTFTLKKDADRNIYGNVPANLKSYKKRGIKEYIDYLYTKEKISAYETQPIISCKTIKINNKKYYVILTKNIEDDKDFFFIKITKEKDEPYYQVITDNLKLAKRNFNFINKKFVDALYNQNENNSAYKRKILKRRNQLLTHFFR
ncbi:hypothetical protein R84B8_00779 [Treponema sp. R8-4-B8]